MLDMTDPYLQSPPGQHDTMALPRLDWPPGRAVAEDVGVVPGFGPGPAGHPGANPEADAWEARYLLQRTRTRVAIGVAAISSLLVLGMGVVVWQMSQVNPLLAAASDLAAGSGNEGREAGVIVPDGTEPEQGVPDGSSSPGSAPGGSAEAPDISIADLPVPEEVKDLAALLGIRDIGQLLDLAVGSGLMAEEDADRLRAAVAIGSLAGG